MCSTSVNDTYAPWFSWWRCSVYSSHIGWNSTWTTCDKASRGSRINITCNAKWREKKPQTKKAEHNEQEDQTTEANTVSDWDWWNETRENWKSDNILNDFIPNHLHYHKVDYLLRVFHLADSYERLGQFMWKNQHCEKIKHKYKNEIESERRA